MRLFHIYRDVNAILIYFYLSFTIFAHPSCFSYVFLNLVVTFFAAEDAVFQAQEHQDLTAP